MKTKTKPEKLYSLSLWKKYKILLLNYQLPQTISSGASNQTNKNFH